MEGKAREKERIAELRALKMKEKGVALQGEDANERFERCFFFLS